MEMRSQVQQQQGDGQDKSPGNLQNTHAEDRKTVYASVIFESSSKID